MKQTLILDSHQLSEFQRCPHLYDLSTRRRWGTTGLREGLIKGSALHALLYLYYKFKIRGFPPDMCVLKAMRYLKYQKKLTKEQLMIIVPKILQYFAHYQNETWIPRRVEVGFSKLLYQDSRFLFVYEGKIDLLMDVQGIPAFVDHKSQAFKKALPANSNQFLGYAWATGYTLGIINYLNLAPSIAPKDAFRREICNYPKNLIQEWTTSAIETYLRVARAQKEGYLKQRNGCLGPYGICDFDNVCNQTHSSVVQSLLEKDFIKKEPWSPWE